MKGIFSIILTGLWTFLSAQSLQEDIHTLLDDWHQAAAVADEDSFFDAMTQDAVYVGTDEVEIWSRDELREWSKKYFERETAWDFKRKTRHLYYPNENADIAWFDETLDTWMGVCRGSGVVVKTDKGWKIKHYVLSVAVPNDKIRDYLELFQKS